MEVKHIDSANKSLSNPTHVFSYSIYTFDRFYINAGPPQNKKDPEENAIQNMFGKPETNSEKFQREHVLEAKNE